MVFHGPVALVMFLGMWSGPSTAQEVDVVPLFNEEVMTARVVSLRDNGELQIQFNGDDGALRLDSIRLPDSESNVREDADALLRRRLIGRSVEVHTRRSEGRDAVRVGYALQDGEDVRVELVTRGLARFCEGMVRERRLEQSDREAKRTGQGIWSEHYEEPLPGCEDPA